MYAGNARRARKRGEDTSEEKRGGPREEKRDSSSRGAGICPRAPCVSQNTLRAIVRFRRRAFGAAARKLSCAQRSSDAESTATRERGTRFVVEVREHDPRDVRACVRRQAGRQAKHAAESPSVATTCEIKLVAPKTVEPPPRPTGWPRSRAAEPTERSRGGPSAADAGRSRAIGPPR